MSQVLEKTKVELSYEDTILIIRKLERIFGNLIETPKTFLIKDTNQRTFLSSIVPATVSIELEQLAENTTIVWITSKNFGMGPIQKKECLSRLDAVKSTIRTEIYEIKNSSNNYNFSAVDEIKKFKELLDSGIISQEEFNGKKKQLLDL